MTATATAKKIVKRTLARAGLRIQQVNAPLGDIFWHAILEEQLRRAGDDFFFVQVGACDGVSFDGLHDFVTRHKPSGIVIEPLKDLYDELCSSYADLPSVTPLNVALHRTEPKMTMYRVPASATGVPHWAKGIGSFDPSHHRRSGIASEHVVTESVRCMSWEALVRDKNITRIDYLQIDAEGYDYEILDMIALDRLRPAVIKFEHQMVDGVRSPEYFAERAARLLANGYQILTMPVDAIAWSETHINGANSPS